MKEDDVVRASQIRGWLRSLCRQNLDQIQNKLRQERIESVHANLLREFQRQRGQDSSDTMLALPDDTFDHLAFMKDQLAQGPKDNSINDEDIANAEVYFHRAFQELIVDLSKTEQPPMMLFHFDREIPSAPKWILEPRFAAGLGGLFGRADDGFKYLDQRLTVREPLELHNTGPWRASQEDQYRYDVQYVLAGSVLVWRKDQMPVLEDLLPYALLPLHHVPEPPIDGLREGAGKRLSPLGMALMQEAKQQSGLRSDAARFLAHGCGQWDDPRLPIKGEWPKVIAAFCKEFTDSAGKEKYQHREPADIEKYFRRAFKSAETSNKTPSTIR